MSIIDLSNAALSLDLMINTMTLAEALQEGLITEPVFRQNFLANKDFAESLTCWENEAGDEGQNEGLAGIPQ